MSYVDTLLTNENALGLSNRIVDFRRYGRPASNTAYDALVDRNNILIGLRPTASTKTQTIKVVYTIGESNSGGEALNSSASANEIDTDRSILKWDNLANNKVYPLDIGFNQNLGHTGFTDALSHGIELQMQNRKDKLGPVSFLVKCGHGGSVIAEWGVEGAYWQAFLTRSAGLNALLTNYGIIPENYVFISFGINDAIAGTNTSSWYTDTLEWINRIITELSPVKLGITKFTENTTAKADINIQIGNLVTTVTDLELIDGSSYSMIDTNHWDYAGMKNLADDFCDLIV